ncbi:leucine-rich repeat-containing protein 74A [Nephila pilipes]|uniref:Leucine-rich repeat-containing protein 74A n=1 Tax=Nephila pilipes TaxID=299642 RepID=A0A8X6N3L9_NEPPI|nr:leucine-rich repeat-containing protein 74A [Nephila pilipes]
MELTTRSETENTQDKVVENHNLSTHSKLEKQELGNKRQSAPSNVDELEKDSEIAFKKTIEETLERLRKLPTTASEIEIPKVKRGVTDIYKKLCKALKVPINSTFLDNTERDAMDFSYQCIGSVGIIAVTKSLILCQTVKDLNLSYNKLGAQSLPAITSLLNQNENILRLSLKGNEIGRNSSHWLIELISTCHCVEFLDLSENDLGDVEFTEIATTLMKVDRIKELILSKNSASAACGLVFGTSINKCSALERLDLSSNFLEEGAAGLFGTFKLSNLKYLNFSDNGINDEAMSDLAKGLRGNKSIQELDLSNNFISNKGIIEFAPALKKNSTLEILRLTNNPFHGIATNVLLRSTGENLKLLDISGIQVNLEFLKTWHKFKKSGRAIKVLFGSVIRHDMLPRDFIQFQDKPIDASNALHFAQQFADEKGISLKHVFNDINADFIKQKATEAPSAEEVVVEDKVRLMTTDEFAKSLMSSELAVPKSMANEIAKALCVDGMVNMWEICSKIKWRPDDLAAKVKSMKKEPPPDKSKDKDKKKKKKK